MNLLPRSQQRRAAMITRSPLHSFLPVNEQNGAHYALYYISQRGFFSLHFYFLLRKGSCLLVTGGSLLRYIFIFFTKKG